MPKRGSGKGHAINIWQVYDMRQSMNCNQIAKKLFGINENSTYNKVVMAYYKQVKRACDKACEIMKQINPVDA